MSQQHTTETCLQVNMCHFASFHSPRIPIETLMKLPHLPSHLLASPSKTLRLRRLPPSSLGHPTMEPVANVETGCESVEGLAEELHGPRYPIPLSPPYPLLSKEVELHRAMSASARSGSYILTSADIVFEDQYLVVANKPAGVYCEAILSSVSSSLTSSAGTSKPELHLANRLDRDTSGLMVITKSHKAAARLVKAFTNHKVRKTYLALCVGNAPNWDKIKISTGHGRSKFGAWRVYSEEDIGRTLPGGSLVKSMVTSLKVLLINGKGQFGELVDRELNGVDSVVVQKEAERKICTSENSNEILIRAYPESGRTHQIRLHCQYLGLPIKGDVKYGGVHEWKGRTCDTHALHAESLSFDHPITGVPVHFQAPLPLWASEICGDKMEDSS